MKRLLFITLAVMAFVLVGALHGGYHQEDRAGDMSVGFAYPESVADKTPDIIFDTTILTPALR
jgi:hypothetical protein